VTARLARIRKALAAFAAALPIGTGTAAAAGGDDVGYLVGVLGAFAIGVVTYLAPANEAPPGSGARRAA
jgi:hypothetical protein